MSHEIETMAYYGEAPWHKLGVKVDNLMTSAEAIQAASLNWEVETVPVFTQEADTFIQVPERFATRRVTDKQIFGLVGKNYTPIQNVEAFAFFDTVIDTGEAHYETCGSLMGGRRIWILANLEGSLGIADEEIRRYITLTNSHDGWSALQMFWTPVRVVCWNTLQMAISGATKSFYARHTQGIRTKVECAQEVLGLTKTYYDDWATIATNMAAKTLSDTQFSNLIEYSLQLPKGADDPELSPQSKKIVERIKELRFGGKGQDNPKIQGTIWQAYNAITEYTDWDRLYRGSDGETTKLNGLWFGTGNEIKNRAWTRCLKLAKKN